MKYNNGDYVRVKSRSELEEILYQENTCLVYDMLEYANRIIRIENSYIIKNGRCDYFAGTWYWPEECLVPPFSTEVDMNALGELLNG